MATTSTRRRGGNKRNSYNALAFEIDAEANLLDLQREWTVARRAAAGFPASRWGVFARHTLGAGERGMHAARERVLLPVEQPAQ